MSKTGKIQKIRYISVITQKLVILKKSKIDFKSTGSVSVSLQPLATLPLSYVSREGLAPIVKAYSRLILVDGLVL